MNKHRKMEILNTNEDIINGIKETIEDINQYNDTNLFDYFICINKKNATQELFELISNNLDLNLISFDKQKLFLVMSCPISNSIYHIYYNYIRYYDDEYYDYDIFDEYRIEIKKL